MESREILFILTFEFGFFFFALTNFPPNFIPYLILSPQPPHLNSPSGGWVGKAPQLQCITSPFAQAFDTSQTKADEARAWTTACSRVPAKRPLETQKCLLAQSMYMMANAKFKSVHLYYFLVKLNILKSKIKIKILL